jgi:hypothetical protein
LSTKSIKRGPHVRADTVSRRDHAKDNFDRLCEQLSSRAACKTIVQLLSLAHERTCEAELAHALEQDLADGRLPDLDELRSRFAPDPAAVPQVHVQLASLRDYEALLTLDQEMTA